VIFQSDFPKGVWTEMKINVIDTERKTKTYYGKIPHSGERLVIDNLEYSIVDVSHIIKNNAEIYTNVFVRFEREV
jgi:hypothetical protein